MKTYFIFTVRHFAPAAARWRLRWRKRSCLASNRVRRLRTERADRDSCRGRYRDRGLRCIAAYRNSEPSPSRRTAVRPKQYAAHNIPRRRYELSSNGVVASAVRKKIDALKNCAYKSHRRIKYRFVCLFTGGVFP